jgi:elongation factor G
MYANHREDVEAVVAGDIAAIPGLNKVRTGDTLCRREQPLLLESIAFPEPVIRAIVEPRRAEDIDGFHAALEKLAEEDPTISVGSDEETGQTVVGAMGELHLEVLLARLEREHDIQSRMGPPQVTNRETITKAVPGVEAVFDQDLGGRAHFASVRLAVEPSEPGAGFRFETEVTRAVLPVHLLAAIDSVGIA